MPKVAKSKKTATKATTKRKSAAKKAPKEKAPPPKKTANDFYGERLNVNYEFLSLHPPVPDRKVCSVVLQGSEPLGSLAVRWELPPPASASKDVDVGKLDAMDSFIDQMKAAFPGLAQYPFVRLSGADISVDCAGTTISPDELVDKACSFYLAGLKRTQLGRPYVRGVSLPLGVTVITLKYDDGRDLYQLLFDIRNAIFQDLCGPRREYLVKVIDWWRIRNVPKKASSKHGRSTKQIALVVKVFEPVHVSRASPHALTYEVVLAPFSVRNPLMPVRQDHKLEVVGSTADAAKVWPSSLFVAGQQCSIEYPGRLAQA